MQSPLITIITVVLNDEKNIEKTILSVLEQNYKNIQYVIIDGDSSDQTKEIINIEIKLIYLNLKKTMEFMTLLIKV